MFHTGDRLRPRRTSFHASASIKRAENVVQLRAPRRHLRRADLRLPPGGRYIKDPDPDLIEDLAARPPVELPARPRLIEHAYPTELAARRSAHLLTQARSCTTIATVRGLARRAFIEANIPGRLATRSTFREGRIMGDWLAAANRPTWALSREPLPPTYVWGNRPALPVVALAEQVLLATSRAHTQRPSGRSAAPGAPRASRLEDPPPAPLWTTFGLPVSPPLGRADWKARVPRHLRVSNPCRTPARCPFGRSKPTPHFENRERFEARI